MKHHHHREHGPTERGRRRSDGQGFGPDDMPFGPGGHIGRGGPMGPGGTFGPGGPMGRGGFGPRGAFGRGRARRGDVRTAILQLLAEEPRNGYQIISELAERSGGAWRPSPGAVYPALSQLEDEGLVESFDNEGSRAFRLTTGGREAPEVHADTRRVWQEWTPEGGSRIDVHSLWREFGELSMALKAVSVSGDPDMATKAETVLSEAKRALYGLLATPPSQAVSPTSE